MAQTPALSGSSRCSALPSTPRSFLGSSRTVRLLIPTPFCRLGRLRGTMLLSPFSNVRLLERVCLSRFIACVPTLRHGDVLRIYSPLDTSTAGPGLGHPASCRVRSQACTTFAEALLTSFRYRRRRSRSAGSTRFRIAKRYDAAARSSCGRTGPNRRHTESVPSHPPLIGAIITRARRHSSVSGRPQEGSRRVQMAVAVMAHRLFLGFNRNRRCHHLDTSRSLATFQRHFPGEPAVRIIPRYAKYDRIYLL